MENRAAGVAIAGAGLIGASIAWRLAQAGVPVTLFDSGKFGGEASSAGAGMLSPGSEFEKPSRWLDLGIEGMAMYPSFVEELRAETGLAIDYQVCGCADLAEGEEEWADARRRAEFQGARGIRVSITEEGLFYPDDAFVNPTDVLRALRKACDSRNVALNEGEPVRWLEASDYAAVVIAAGAWSGAIRVTNKKRACPIPGVVPVKGHLIGFEMAPGALGAMRRHGHTYVLQRSNGFVIAGSTEEDRGFDRKVDPEICEDIHRRAAKLFPALEAVMPSERWIGFRPRGVDNAGPHIGRVSGMNVWLAYGHYRNGILLAPLTAQRVAGEISKFLAS